MNPKFPIMQEDIFQFLKKRSVFSETLKAETWIALASLFFFHILESSFKATDDMLS